MSTGYLWHEVFGWHDTGTGTLFPPTPPPATSRSATTSPTRTPSDGCTS